MDYYIIYDIRIQYETHFNIRIQDIQGIEHMLETLYHYLISIIRMLMNPYITINTCKMAIKAITTFNGSYCLLIITTFKGSYCQRK